MVLLKHKKKIITALLLACVGYAWSCVAAIPKQAPPMVPERSSWLVYWDWQQGLKKAALQDDQALIAFAVHFNEKNRLTLPQGLDFPSLQQAKALQGRRVYLSFVNDKKSSKGVLLKDTAILKALLEKEYTRHHHIEEIVALCTKNNFAGIEIDYENIWQDEALIASFAKFVSELKAACENKGLKLRVVLEPKTLVYAESLPEKIEYVVMLYNLYGPHSRPGPKANEKFILRTIKQVEKLRGTPTLAFANGGFAWTECGKVHSLTQAQAEALAKKYLATPTRDKDSRALFYTYEDKGKTYSVWYADELTVAFWRTLVEKYGYQRFSLWRL